MAWGFIQEFMHDRLNAASMESEWHNESQLSNEEVNHDQKNNNEKEFLQSQRKAIYQNWYPEQPAKGCKHRYWRTCGCLSKEERGSGE